MLIGQTGVEVWRHERRMYEGVTWSEVTMVSVWASVPCGVWPLVPGPANIHE